jgi:hypothetical protein
MAGPTNREPLRKRRAALVPPSAGTTVHALEAHMTTITSEESSNDGTTRQERKRIRARGPQ